MATEPSEALYTVTVTAVRDEKSRQAVVDTLSSVTKNVPKEKIHEAMQRLPWTITRRASVKKATRLMRLIEKLGASVDVNPPLGPARLLPDVGETVILPQADMISDSHVGPSEDFTAPPPRQAPPPRFAASPPVEAAPASPGPIPETVEVTAPVHAAFDLEPLTLGGVLDRSVRMCRSHFWKLFFIVSIPTLVLIAVGIVGVLVFLAGGFAVANLQELSWWTWVPAAIAIVITLVLVIIVVSSASEGALIHSVARIHLGEGVSVREAWRFGMGKVPRLFVTGLLVMLVWMAVLIGYGLALGLLGVLGTGLFFASQQLLDWGWWSAGSWPLLAWIAMAVSAVLMYVCSKLLLFDKIVIIEDRAYWSAVQRSWDLFKGGAEGESPIHYWLRFLILLHVYVGVYLAVFMLLQFPFTLMELLMPRLAIVWKISGQVSGTFGSLLAQLFVWVSSVVYYYDLRVRKEGFDLQMLARIAPR